MRQIPLIAALLLMLVPQATAQVSQATIATVEASVEDDGSVTVTVTGTLPNSCVDVDDVTYDISGDTITIRVETSRPDPTVMCAQALVDFTGEVVIPADALEPREYTVVAGRFSTTLDYEAGAGADGSSDEEAAEATRIPPARIPEVCTLPDEEQALFVDDSNGYCFTYPRAFELVDEEDAEVALVREGGNDEPSARFTLVRTSSSLDVTLELQADLEAALLDEEGEYAVERTLLGDRPVLQVDAQREEVSLRRVYVITTEGFLVLTLTPTPGVDENAALLWDALSETFAFFVPLEEAE